MIPDPKKLYPKGWYGNANDPDPDKAKVMEGLTVIDIKKNEQIGWVLEVVNGQAVHVLYSKGPKTSDLMTRDDPKAKGIDRFEHTWIEGPFWVVPFEMARGLPFRAYQPED